MKRYCQRPVNLDEELDDAWQLYKSRHPEQSYGRVMKILLRNFLTEQECLPCKETMSPLSSGVGVLNVALLGIAITCL